MSDTKYPDFIESTGYGTGDGLCGWNCRHHFQAWAEGLRNPYTDENGNLKIDSEENRKRYELQQKQRAMERSLRAWKRKLIVKEQEIAGVAETDVKEILQRDYDRMAYQLTQKNKAYNDFCAANDLQPQYDRIKVADFGREHTKRSNAGAKRYKEKDNG